MNTSKLKTFAQAARRQLIQEVSSRLEHAIRGDSAVHREKSQAISNLEKEIGRSSKQIVIERAAYIWFNRICALRFMDVNRYTRMGVVSPAEGFTQPEILSEAKQGHIDEELYSHLDRERITHLLTGRISSLNPQQEAYRMLLVAVCNLHHSQMPFLFQKIHDYTELLLPDDLLSENSFIHAVCEVLTPETCTDVEVIGWLYQFYISEKKDEVFEGLKKGKKIAPENIPAATQLFTPHWIVRYLVENSLGRLWMLNHPGSRLIERMDYYIKPEKTEPDFLRISTPDEIKICDPACGSGHMLVYAFDLLFAIYEEEGNDPIDIPRLILENNLFGIEIDERAGELASFALFMKARDKDRRFFRRGVQPKVRVLKNVFFKPEEVATYMDAVGRDLFTNDLQKTLRQFEEADNFGSLIRPNLKDYDYVRRVLKGKNISGNWILHETHQKVLCVLEQAEYLSQRYHVVIANPPYMGGKGMNSRLGVFAKESFPESKSHLCTMFIERNLDMAMPKGFVAMINMQSWMFLSSFEKLRSRILGKETILSMVHLGARAFDSIGGEVVSTTAFILKNANHLVYKGVYLRLVNCNSEANKKAAIKEGIKNLDCGWYYLASSVDLKKIPGSPIAYWVSEELRNSFLKHQRLGEFVFVKSGMSTTNNDRFLRIWHEIQYKEFKSDSTDAITASKSGKKWFPYIKGGTYRRWYGNLDYVVNWKDDGAEIKHFVVNNPRDPKTTHWSRRIFNSDYFFQGLLAWSRISMSSLSVRLYPTGMIFSDASNGCFGDIRQLEKAALLLNSKVVSSIMEILSPTMNFYSGDVERIPAAFPTDHSAINKLVEIATLDWDSYETSWNFTKLPLLHSDYCQTTLKATYQKLRSHWKKMSLGMKHLEEENNHILIKAYALQDELTPDVPIDEISLTCNPYYRYGSTKKEEELEALLLADTMKEFISYAVGCMFGRYSLDKPGLIMANQGENVADYLAQVPKPSFAPDEDNVLPILDSEWFTDDIVGRFRKFLRVTFGEEHYQENLSFIEQALGKDIRKYFIRDFYNDHVKRYKKRPIYWLFSSPKGNFNALIYMHRYRPDTVSVILNDYLRDFRAKLAARKGNLEHISISASSSQKEKTQAIKEIDKLSLIAQELDDYERDILYPLATRRIEIDLDDGVKVNYPKFGQALKKIPGLEESDD